MPSLKKGQIVVYNPKLKDFFNNQLIGKPFKIKQVDTQYVTLEFLVTVHYWPAGYTYTTDMIQRHPTILTPVNTASALYE